MAENCSLPIGSRAILCVNFLHLLILMVEFLNRALKLDLDYEPKTKIFY